MPCLGLADLLQGRMDVLEEHPYSLVILYTVTCAILYAFVGLAIGLSVRGAVSVLHGFREAKEDA